LIREVGGLLGQYAMQSHAKGAAVLISHVARLE
jgi:hypothetical protein